MSGIDFALPFWQTPHGKKFKKELAKKRLPKKKSHQPK